MEPYVVQQGDTMTRLGLERGFVAADAWADSTNDDLRAIREHMDMLAPGDIVHLPDSTRQLKTLSPQQANKFSAKEPTVTIALTLTETDGTAAANKAFKVYSGGPPIDGTTDGDGKATVKLPAHVRQARLVLTDTGHRLDLLVGHLDPPNTESGIDARLRHLGYLTGTPDDESRTRAIQDFQRDQELTITGEIDDDTRQHLVDRHGL